MKPDVRADTVPPVRAPDAQAGVLHVEVAYSPAGAGVDLTALELPAGATLAQAVAASGVLGRHGLNLAHTPTGIWGRRAAAQAPLRDGDRVELYRPLLCDPKEARRARHRRQRQRQSPRGSRDSR